MDLFHKVGSDGRLRPLPRVLDHGEHLPDLGEEGGREREGFLAAQEGGDVRGVFVLRRHNNFLRPEYCMDLLVATMAPELTGAPVKYRSSKDTMKNIIIFMLTHAVSFFAVYLSWNCSTQQGLQLPMKMAWALLAYCFGFIYVLAFAFKTRNACGLLL